MKILCNTPAPSDGTSWYRAVYPLARMQQFYDDFQVLEYGSNQVQWNDMIHFDVLFMQRPFHKVHVEMMMKAKMHGLKIWMDFDDLLWGVPEHNLASGIYEDPDVIASLGLLLNNAYPQDTVISVSSNQLKREVLTINPHATVVVVPNALDKNWMPEKSNYDNFSRPYDLCWRGSDTHQMDLYTYRQSLELILQIHKVEFIGHKPFFLSGYSHSRHGLEEYFYYLKTRKWDTFFACFEDNLFNRCKSNILWLEAFYAGAITVAPAWEEWKVPGIINYPTEGNYQMEFREAIETALNTTYERKNFMWLQAQEYIQDHLTLDITNQIRYDMLQKLMKGMPAVAAKSPELFIDTE